MWDTTSIMPLQIRWINQMSKFSGSNCHGPQHYIFSKHLKPWAYLPVHSLCSHSKTQFQKYCWTVAGWLTAGTDFLELMVVWAVHTFLVVSTAVGVAFVMSFCTSAHQHCFMYIQSQIPFNRMSVWTDTHTHTHTRDSDWQWHQLGHMQVCTLLQADNHASTLPLSFLQAGCLSCRLTNSVKALNLLKAHWTEHTSICVQLITTYRVSKMQLNKLLEDF